MHVIAEDGLIINIFLHFLCMGYKLIHRSSVDPNLFRQRTGHDFPIFPNKAYTPDPTIVLH